MAGHSFGSVNIKNKFIAAAGSVSAPSIYFSTNSGSGLYQIGANNIGLTISGNKIVDVASTSLGVSITDAANDVCVSRFLNPSEIATKFVSIAVGNAYSTSNCATFGYVLNSTLANSTGSLGIHTNNIINWNYNTVGRVGINQAPSTEALEVTGNIKSSATILATTSMQTPIIYPSGNSTTALKLTKADASTGVLIVDTTNSRVSIGTGAAPAAALDVTGLLKTDANSDALDIYSAQFLNAGAVTDGRYHYLLLGKSSAEYESVIMTYRYDTTATDCSGRLGISGKGTNIAWNHDGTNRHVSICSTSFDANSQLYVEGRTCLYSSASSASAPSLYFTTGEATTGLYRIGANNLGVSIEGNKLLDIAAAGLTVGPATGSPLQPLKLSNNGFTASFQMTTLTADRTITVPNADVNLGSLPNQSLDTTSSPQFAYLGINQAAGTERLEVTGSIKAYANSDSQLILGKFLNAGLATTGNITFISVGKDESANNCALLSYYYDAETLANSIGRLGIFANGYSNSIIQWSYNTVGRVGINQAPGTEALEVTGNIKASGTISTPQIYLDNAAPSFQGMGLSWNVQGGLGRGTFINNRGTIPVVPGGFEWGTYESSTYKEVMRLHPTRMYAGYGMGVIDGTMTNGESTLLSTGKSYGVNYESALLGYVYDSGTLANSYGALCLYGATNAISFNGSNKVGINQAPGTYTLEVNGGLRTNSGIITSVDGATSYALAIADNTARGQFCSCYGAGNYFNNAVAGDIGIRQESTSYSIRFGCGAGDSTVAIKNGLVGINQNVGSNALEVAGTIKSTTGDIVSEASRVFLQGAAPNQDNALFMRWQGGTGKSYIVCASGSGSGEIGMGHYNSSSYKEQFAIGLTGGIRVYNTGGTGSAAIGQFYNTDLAAGNDVAILLGKNTVDPGDNAWMLYHRDASTLANSIGKLGIWAYNSSLTWGGSGKVGIGDNKTPGTETLEVAGNIACTDLKPSGAYYWQPAQNFYLTATGNNSEWSMDLTPGTYTGVNWSVFNSTTGQPALSVGVSNTYNGKVGINQAYGTENLEVNGTAYITGPAVWIKNVAHTGTGAKPQGTYLLWNMVGGTGRTYLVNEQGLGANPGISLGRFDHTSGDFVEYMGLDNIGNLNVNYSGGTGGSDIATFYNSSLATGQSIQMHIGSATSDNNSAWFQYVKAASAYGVLGIWGNAGCIFWDRPGRVGIAQTPDPSWMFTVNGGIRTNYGMITSVNGATSYALASADNTIRGQFCSCYGGGNYFGNAAGGDIGIRQEDTGKSILLGCGGGTSTISIKNGLVGINQNAGSNALEVNGSLSANNYPSSVTSYQTNIVTNGTPVTMTANTLYYQRTGNVVHVMGTLSWSAAGDGSSTYPSIFLPIAAGVGIYAPVTYTNGTTGLVHTTGGWVQAYLHNADSSQVTPFNSLGMGSGSMWINFSYVI